MPGMGVFELHSARKYCLGSGLAPQTLIPLYPIRQQAGFWIPMIRMFEVQIAKKYYLRSGVTPQTPIRLYSIGQQKEFLDTYDADV